jgi:hypothetical protein
MARGKKHTTEQIVNLLRQFLLEDRAGRDVPFLAHNLAKFMAAARKRPEIGSISPHSYRACRKSSFGGTERDSEVLAGAMRLEP